MNGEEFIADRHRRIRIPVAFGDGEELLDAPVSDSRVIHPGDCDAGVFLGEDEVITARFLIAQFQYAVLLIFIISAVITPTGDPVTQTVFAAPMIGLYAFGIVIAWVVGPKRLTE